jgi:hypothetical protein
MISAVKDRTALAATLGGTAGVMTVVIGSGLIVGAEAGSMADWVAAVATVAAFCAAVIAARYAAGAFSLESAREAQILQAQRTAQAALVAAWPDRFLPNWEQQHNSPDLRVPGIRGAVAMLRNASDVPVTGIHVDFSVVHAFADAIAVADIRYLGGLDLAVLPPGPDPKELRWAADGVVMVPGVPTMGDGDDYPDFGTYDPGRLLVTITFRDAAGVLWHRDRAGHLSEVLEAPDTTGRATA